MIEPPEPLNVAEHLFATNRRRAGKVAYVDDRGALAYGDLEDRSRRFAAALVGLGIRREERVLLVMLDCNEWPVAFLGALYAGVVPVAVNTLLTVADYAYMLAHSRAQAAIVSASLEPTLRKAMAEAPSEVGHVIVAGAAIASGADSIDFDSLVERAQPLAAPERFEGLAFERFSLQPMDGPEVIQNTARAIDYCLNHPQWRLSVQTHKSLGIR